MVTKAIKNRCVNDAPGKLRPSKLRPSKLKPGKLAPADLGPIEQIPIELLKPYPGNARTHSKKQLARIAASLESFGWMNPILADKDGTIIAGHGRWQAARSLGFTHCPVIRVEHLTPDQVRAYRLADNQLAQLSGWDEDILKIELQHLSDIEVDLDFSLETIGWDHAEIDVMLETAPAEKSDDGAFDPVDENVSAPEHDAVTRLDDIWLLAEHRVLCGSALEPDAFAQLMGGRQAAMAFVDAPYNCPIDGHVSGLGDTKHREFAMASGELTEDAFRAFLGDNGKLLSANCSEGAIIMMCMDWRQLLPLHLAIRDAGLAIINMAVWAKNNGGMGSLLRSQYELVLITKKGRAPHINNVQLGKHKRYRTNVWRYPGVNSFGKGRMEQVKGHPTPKPVAMVADAIRDVSHRGQIVLDSFLGSGTTLLAAERTKRICYGMDIDPVYVDLTIRRWEAMTGQQAVLAATGQSFAEVQRERHTK
jgi:DNA modification methylase